MQRMGALSRSKPVEDEVIFHKGDMDGLLSMLSGGEEAVEGGDAAGGSSDAEPALDMGSDHWGPSEECWRDGDPVAAQRLGTPLSSLAFALRHPKLTSSFCGSQAQQR